MKKCYKITSILLIITMFLCSCVGERSVGVIKKVMPDYDKRMYTEADLLSLTKEDMNKLYDTYEYDLINFFYSKVSTNSVYTGNKRDMDSFNNALRYRTHNFKMLERRKAKFEDVANSTENADKCLKERKEFFELKNAKSSDIIKKYNDGKEDGFPKMTILVDLSTATVSSTTNLVYEAECDIFEPLYFDNERYNSLKVGDIVELEIPEENDGNNVRTTLVKKKVFYVATNSFTYKDTEKNGYKDRYYYLAEPAGTSNYRRLLDEDGLTVEMFRERKKLQFLKYARVVSIYDEKSLLDAIDSEDEELDEYYIGDIIDRGINGSIVAEDNNNSIYANCITTNKKGYITSLTGYMCQIVNNKFYGKMVVDKYDKIMKEMKESEEQDEGQINQ